LVLDFELWILGFLMDNYLTKEGLEKLKKELEYLKTVKKKEIAERLRHAISFGDLKENAAYSEAKDAQAFLEGRILDLEALINGAVVIKKGAKDKAQIGSNVTISQIGKDFSEEKFTIVGSAEADPLAGRISADSPMGKIMLGLKQGNTFKINTPEGKIKYKIIKIE